MQEFLAMVELFRRVQDGNVSPNPLLTVEPRDWSSARLPGRLVSSVPFAWVGEPCNRIIVPFPKGGMIAL